MRMRDDLEPFFEGHATARRTSCSDISPASTPRGQRAYRPEEAATVAIKMTTPAVLHENGMPQQERGSEDDEEEEEEEETTQLPHGSRDHESVTFALLLPSRPSPPAPRAAILDDLAAAVLLLPEDGDEDDADEKIKCRKKDEDEEIQRRLGAAKEGKENEEQRVPGFRRGSEWLAARVRRAPTRRLLMKMEKTTATTTTTTTTVLEKVEKVSPTMKATMRSTMVRNYDESNDDEAACKKRQGEDLSTKEVAPSKSISSSAPAVDPDDNKGKAIRA